MPRRKPSVPDHIEFLSHPKIDTGKIETVGGAALFAFIDSEAQAPTNIVPEPDDVPPHIPESTTDPVEVARFKEKDTVVALERVFDVFNQDGKIQGRETMGKMTYDNHFQTRYSGGEAGAMADRMDGRLSGLKVRAGLETFNKPADEKTNQEKDIEAEGRWVLDTLNDTAARLLAGESTEDVEASRDRLRQFLLRELDTKPDQDGEPREGELKTGAFRYVDDKDGYKIRRKITAEDRKKRLKNPQEVSKLVEKLRLNSR